MSTDFQPHGLLTDDDELVFPPMDFDPVLEFTRVIQEVDLVRIIDLTLSIIPDDPSPLSGPVDDIKRLGPPTQLSYAKLRPTCKALEGRTAPMAVAFCLGIKAYAESVIKSYPAMFSKIRALHNNPNDEEARSQIENTIKAQNSLIARNKNVAQFVFNELGVFQEVFKETIPQIEDARTRLAADVQKIKEADLPLDWYVLLLVELMLHYGEIQRLREVKIPEHPFNLKVLQSIETMMGTWDAIEGDLKGIADKLDADELEEMANIILNINEKQLLSRWDALRNQCTVYVDGNLKTVQDRIDLDLNDAGVLRDFEVRILLDDGYFAPMK